MVPKLISPTGKSYAEMESYKWIPFNQVNLYLGGNIGRIVNETLKRIYDN